MDGSKRRAKADVSKAILLILILLLAYLIFRGQRKKGGGHAPADASVQPVPEKMVVCARCRLHVPEDESVTAAGQRYCCDEHRQLGPS